MGRIETLPGDRHRPHLALGLVPPADLDIPILGQPALARFPLGDALEQGPLEIVRLEATPLSTPNSTACRLASSLLPEEERSQQWEEHPTQAKEDYDAVTDGL